MFSTCDGNQNRQTGDLVARAGLFSVGLCTQCMTCSQICFIQSLSLSLSLSLYIYIYIYIAACRAVSRQCLGKHVPAATDTNATIEVLLETMSFTRSVQRGYKKENYGNQVSSLREAVKRGLERGSWRISTVGIRYQGTTGEDTAGWKILNVCCGDL
jgi:hypothetical protein